MITRVVVEIDHHPAVDSAKKFAEIAEVVARNMYAVTNVKVSVD